MGMTRHRRFTRSTAVAVLFGSALLLPAGIAVAAGTDGTGTVTTLPVPGTGAPEYEAEHGRPAEALKVTKRAFGIGTITYTLNSGDTAELFWAADGTPGARLPGTGTEDRSGPSAPAERMLVSKTGVGFSLTIPAIGEQQPWAYAEKGKDGIRLEFPPQPAPAKDFESRTVSQSGVEADSGGGRQGNGTLLLAGGAAATAALGVCVLRRRSAG